MPLKLVLNPDSMSLSTPDTTPVFPTPRIPMASLDSSTNIDLNRQLEDIELVARAPTQQKEPHISKWAYMLVELGGCLRYLGK